MLVRFRKLVLPVDHRAGALAILGGLCLYLPCAMAETTRTDDYLAIAFEAESASKANERWVLTTAGTPAQAQDPDGNHSDLAAGGAYLELLPDTRVTHDDELITESDDPAKINYWGYPGAGPRAEYPIDIPEPGRYYVHMRALSTGKEDNGIHVGLDGIFPQSGARSQFCISGAGWQWRYNQRESGGKPCGVPGTIYLNIDKAETHTFMVSAREDGFELDSILLLKDLSSNTRVCEPQGKSNIQCRDGSYDFADEKLDLQLKLASDVDALKVGESVKVTLNVHNLDNFDTATGGTLSVVVDESFRQDTALQTLAETCTVTGNKIDCVFGELTPQAEIAPVVLSLTAMQAGLLRVDASITSNTADDNSTNNAAQLLVDVSAVVEQTSAKVTLSAPEVTAGSDAGIALTVSNTGKAIARNARVTISRPGGVSMTAPAECTVMNEVVCNLGDLAAGESRVVNLSLQSPPAGTYAIDARLSADNDSSPADNAAEVSLAVTLPAPKPDPDPDSEPPVGNTGDTGADNDKLDENTTATPPDMNPIGTPGTTPDALPVTTPDATPDATPDTTPATTGGPGQGMADDESDGGAMGLSLAVLLTGAALRRRRQIALRSNPRLSKSHG